MNRNILGLLIASTVLIQGCNEEPSANSSNEAEPNDTAVQANELAIPGTIRGAVHDVSDYYDVFKITPGETGTYGFELTGPEDADIDLYLGLADETELAYSENFGSNESITYSLTANQDYFLLVNAYDTLGIAASYTLTTFKVEQLAVEQLAEEYQDVEPNDSTAEAIALNLTEVRTGNVNSQDDRRDFYVVTPETSGTYNISLDAFNYGSADLDLFLYNAQFSYLTESSSLDSNESISYDLSASQNYYVTVDAFSTSGIDIGYTLELTQ